MEIHFLVIEGLGIGDWEVALFLPQPTDTSNKEVGLSEFMFLLCSLLSHTPSLFFLELLHPAGLTNHRHYLMGEWVGGEKGE